MNGAKGSGDKPFSTLYSNLIRDDAGGAEVTTRRVPGEVERRILDQIDELEASVTDAETPKPDDLGPEATASVVDQSNALPAQSTAPAREVSSNVAALAPGNSIPSAVAASAAGEQRETNLAPPKPKSLKDVGMSAAQLGEMILRSLYLQGSLTGFELAGELRLPYGLVDEPLRFLCDEKCLEVTSGQMFGRISYRFQLTDLGRTRAREAFEQCRYVGPAPVKLSDYVEYCRRQTVAGLPCHEEQLRDAFRNLVISDSLMDELGPAVCSGRSIFLYGPPGNGKTVIGKGLGRLLNRHGGDIFVPYAIQAEGAIITLFDPTVHQPTDEKELTRANVAGRLSSDDPSVRQEELWDLRWRRIRRPVVITGGELTLGMLDLRYNSVSNFYQAPVHIKANGGVFLVDDFGRQIVSPRDLLNRWIVPLEERLDYLTLSTGKKIQVPFEQLSVFSTNLSPADLVDDAFARRIRHKILIGSPTRQQLTEMFRLSCQDKDIAFDETAVQELFRIYEQTGRESRSSDARDLLETIKAVALYRGTDATMNVESIRSAAAKFFGESGWMREPASA